MYAELYQYLVQHKELPVPGIGTFLLERKPAAVDFPNRMINPPSYAVSLQAGSYVPGQRFFSWLAVSLGITDREAIFRFNDFAFEMKKQISDGAVIEWDGMGTLKRGLSGDVKFNPSTEERALEKPVPADKVIREKAEHMVRVGEDERTAEEMTEMLNRTEEKRSYWWAWSLAIALLAIIFIGWYFSQHGLVFSSTANSTKLVPGETPAAYQSTQ
jgi:hypothetical protein